MSIIAPKETTLDILQYMSQLSILNCFKHIYKIETMGRPNRNYTFFLILNRIYLFVLLLTTTTTTKKWRRRADNPLSFVLRFLFCSFYIITLTCKIEMDLLYFIFNFKHCGHAR